ncbi:MAG: GTP-binding protein [Bacteroidetes bacterium]|nr:GTP-binding protein [Bacteroidota bacterium]
METKHTIPVTVLTGFLGSGKTTLLNRILSENHGKKIAVIENEFGEVGVDNELVIGADEEIFEMNNGCICCTVRGDLIRILDQLMKRKDKLDYIIIETTGMANPAPVAQTFWVDDEMRESFSLDAIITIVDAKHVWLHIDNSSECQEQIAFADVILLNKIDLVSEQELEKLEQKIKSMNSQAKLYKSKDANIDLNSILNIKAFDLDAKVELNPGILIEEVPFEWCGIFDFNNEEYQIKMTDGPDPSIDVVIVALNDNSDVEIEKAKKSTVKIFSEEYKEIKPDKFLNANRAHNRLLITGDQQTYYFKPSKKGFYAIFTQHGPEEFNMQFESSRAKSSATEPSGIKKSTNKISLDNLKIASQNLILPLKEIEFAHSHEHDNAVSSVGIEDESALNIEKVNEWISWLLREKGTDIFRMKGILNIHGNDERFVFQGVHMLFDAQADRKWRADEKRRNQLVFIGKNLDREELVNGFKKCIVKNQPKLA